MKMNNNYVRKLYHTGWYLDDGRDSKRMIRAKKLFLSYFYGFQALHCNKIACIIA